MPGQGGIGPAAAAAAVAAAAEQRQQQQEQQQRVPRLAEAAVGGSVQGEEGGLGAGAESEEGVMGSGWERRGSDALLSLRGGFQVIRQRTRIKSCRSCTTLARGWLNISRKCVIALFVMFLPSLSRGVR